MAKIVVLAGADDSAEATAALDAASIEYEVVDPTPANILHLVIGMVGDDTDDDENADDTDADGEADPDDATKKKKDVPDPTAKGGDGVAASTKTDDEAPDDSDIASDASAVAESLGSITLNGEMIEAKKSNSRDTYLYVPSLIVGAKTSYSLNESTFSFWPADTKNPAQRVLIEHNGRSTSTEVEVRKSKASKAYLAVGADLADIFKTK